MNFFKYQDQARRQSRRLVFLFILAVLAIVAAVDFALLLGFGLSRTYDVGLFTPEGLSRNASLLLTGTVGTIAVILVASLFKTAMLRSGGGQVARALGGTLVDADSRDPMRRRLRNVVEEIAIASGVPVPEIYVLEQEPGINAFAAGYSPSDAAVAVTRGAMEKLSRNELQGVVAHEFSHIFNGDMRLNIRLMGALFGILVLALIGRRILHHTHHIGRGRDNAGAAIVVLALVLVIVGYLGLFFGRWIKSAVSRQREYLADASAVQFTRDPDGISGALKKIAVYGEGSYLLAESEEVEHMLFGDGQKMSFFATHPPLVERIQRIQPDFRKDDLKVLADRIRRADAEQKARAEREAQRAERRQAEGGAAIFDPARFIEQIGNPDWQELWMAAALAASIPEPVAEAARSVDWAAEALLLTLLDRNPEVRERQLLAVARQMGSDSESRLRNLLKAHGLLAAEQRLPVLEMALPSLKRHPPDFIRNTLNMVTALVEADGRVDVFEYLLGRLVRQYLWESQNPHAARNAGKRRLGAVQDEALAVIGVLARHGHAESADAERAFSAGATVLDAGPARLPGPIEWPRALDRALERLDELSMSDKETLVRALVETVTHDGQLVPAELELMRAACALLHVPLPVMAEQATR
ncbi:MAG: M48 family metalloprotease [Xanthomonadales bacterium]|nr:M48 family metalloprotease [Xanthomonadales bacterium]